MESGEEQPTLSLKALTRSGYPPPPPGNFPDVAEALSGSSRPPPCGPRLLCDTAATCRGPSSEAAGCTLTAQNRAGRGAVR